MRDVRERDAQEDHPELNLLPEDLAEALAEVQHQYLVLGVSEGRRQWAKSLGVLAIPNR